MFAFNKAVPRTGLLLQEPPGRLALDRPTWGHLLAYVDKVERLPADLSLLSAGTREAVEALRTALRPDPSTGALWVVDRLRAGAAAMAAALQRLREGGAALPASEWKERLLELGAIAQEHRNGVSSVAHALRTAAPGLLQANAQLAAAFAADAQHLQHAQEAVGTMKAHVADAERRLGERGLLAALTQHGAAEKKLETAKADFEQAFAQGEQLREAVAAVSAIANDAGWLAPALDAVLGFVEQAQATWTQVGSGVAQVAADATTAQLEDPAWREGALGLEAAAAQWQAISQAAQAFVAGAPAGWAAKVLHEESLS